MEFSLQQYENWAGGKVYDVVIDGAVVGAVEQCWPTFERAPRGATYVTKRWTAKKPYWRIVGQRRGLDYETRKRAGEVCARLATRRAEEE